MGVAEKAEKQDIKAEDRGEKIDYITFVPNGEPTLEVNLGRAAKLRRLGCGREINLC
ncbi:MAG: hypothetical protein ACLFVP_01950 [Candidatus Bathyarchaeia archaeon]